MNTGCAQINLKLSNKTKSLLRFTAIMTNVTQSQIAEFAIRAYCQNELKSVTVPDYAKPFVEDEADDELYD